MNLDCFASTVPIADMVETTICAKGYYCRAIGARHIPIGISVLLTDCWLGDLIKSRQAISKAIDLRYIKYFVKPDNIVEMIGSNQWFNALN